MPTPIFLFLSRNFSNFELFGGIKLKKMFFKNVVMLQTFFSLKATIYVFPKSGQFRVKE